MEALRDGLYQLLEADHPQTIRGLFYQAVSTGLIPKTEASYKTVVIRLMVEMRLNGRTPFDWIVDSTRLQRKPVSWSSLDDALASTARTYRRELWTSMPAYVEIWSEKDTIAGILFEETAAFDVPLMICRGYSSLSFLKSAAEYIEHRSQPTYIYHFGDFDPSGVGAAENVERRLREFAPNEEIHFERVAVTEEQIDTWDLQTRPTKTTDSRSKGFGSRSVELEAVPAWQLRELARDSIARHIDQAAYDRIKATEREERVTLLTIARRGAA